MQADPKSITLTLIAFRGTAFSSNDDEEMVVLAFGDNGDGQVGVGHKPTSYNPLATPVPVRHPRDVAAFRGQAVTHVACGGAHTLVAIMCGAGDCSLYAFGLNSSGQLGIARGHAEVR